MKKISLNIQSVVAMVFLLIFLLAAYTSIFSQEKQEPAKKERTKIITMKVVEDENGKVKTIDTTYVLEGDNFSAENFAHFEFENQQVKLDSMLKNMQLWIDKDDNVFQFYPDDSLMFQFDLQEDFLKDQEENLKRINEEMEERMKEFENQMKTFSYTYSIDSEGDGDSIQKFIIIHSDEIDGFQDSIIEKHINYRTGKGNFIVTGDKNKMEVIENDGKTVIVKSKPGGTTTLEYDRDTIIEGGNCKIIIKSKELGEGSGKEKQVQVFAVVDGKSINGGDSTDVIVTVDGDNYTVKTINDKKKIILVKTAISSENLNKADHETLKNAGVKTKNNNLEIEDLKFAPNPSNGKFTLSFTLKEKKKVTVNIYDMRGNIVYTETIRDFQGHYSKEIDISDQGTGTFFLQIVQGLYDIIKKIIIE